MTQAEKVELEQLGSRGIWVHDPSTIVKCKDTYWIFCTGRGVPSYTSQDLKTWNRGPAVLTKPPAWQTEAVPKNRGTGYWAPDVLFHKDKYLLFFSVSTFGANTSAIGVTTNKTLDPDDPEYSWTEPRLVIKSDPSCNYNAIDPGVVVDQEGKLWMSFGSFWNGIQLVELDPDTGTRIAPDSPVTTLADYDSIEAPHIYHHDGYYYLFLNWGICCRGTRSTYNIRVGRSKKITGPYLDQEDKDMTLGGGTLLLETEGNFVGPGHPGIWQEADKHYLGMHFYNGAMNGVSQYAIRPLTWDEDGWPSVELPSPTPDPGD
ncbi:arabinan endo-1,5-alpha-L-arabinosidase [Aeoliella straminimaris]|nr:arabinan endo-1,5-alpha-L-arabinosidase [Aeoliella straminimaris]